jgi:hypothetical protein
MKPITQQQIVHLRLLSTLPVRTHCRPPPKDGGSPHLFTPVRSVILKNRIRKLKAEGRTPREIASIVGKTTQTVYNHLRTQR